MKLLQRLRTMGQGVESTLERRHRESPDGAPLPGLSRDDFLDPPGETEFEPALASAGDARVEPRR
jgi:hypothetical protein